MIRPKKDVTTLIKMYISSAQRNYDSINEIKLKSGKSNDSVSIHVRISYYLRHFLVVNGILRRSKKFVF